jgi:solute carrier family 35 protein E3
MSDRERVPVSLTRAAQDLNPRIARLNKPGDDEEKQRLSGDLEAAGDLEDDNLLPKEKQGEQPAPKSSFTSGLVWMVINTLATIGIVKQTPFRINLVNSY